MAKEFRQINVKTLPNGYAMSVEGVEYMYFSEKELLEGFMFHVGLEENGFLDGETIAEFLTASLVWRKDNGQTSKKMIKLVKENESLLSRNSYLQNRIKQMERANGARGKSEIKELLEDEDD